MNPFLRDSIGSIPVIGTFLRYLYWLITCPIRINRLLDEIKTLRQDIHRIDLMQDEVVSHSARTLEIVNTLQRDVGEQFDRLTTDIGSSTGIRLITNMRFASYIATLGRAEFEAHCRSRRSYEYLGESRGLCRILGQPLMFVDTNDMTFTPHMIMYGFWEPWITLFLASLIKPGMVAVDLGANHGYYTLLLADGVGNTGSVVAVEPLPSLARLLRFSIELNGYSSWVRVVQAAAMDNEGEVTIAIRSERPMNTEVIEAQRHQRDYTDRTEMVKVRCATLDQIVGSKTVDIIKIDVEGAEWAAWTGMAGLLARNPDIQVIMEFNAARYNDPPGFLTDICAAGFPLRFIAYDAQAKPITAERLLTEHVGEDWMLYLCR
jgi:FkbM family methyltransferase